MKKYKVDIICIMLGLIFIISEWEDFYKNRLTVSKIIVLGSVSVLGVIISDIIDKRKKRVVNK